MESSTAQLKLPSGRSLRQWLSTRNGTLAVAGVVALAALALLMAFMSQYRKSVAPGPTTANVLVASRTIQRGTSGGLVARRQMFRLKTIPATRMLAGAFADGGALRGQIATQNINPGEQLTIADFQPCADPITSQLAGGDRAVSVPIDGTHGNLGQIAAGSHVDVLGSPETSANASGRPPTIYVLARNILVLKAPGAGGEGGGFGGGDGSSDDVVLRLPTNQMRQILTTADKGTIWLLIRPPTVAKELKLGRL